MASPSGQGMGMRQTPRPSSEAENSDYVFSSTGKPLILRMRLFYEKSDDRNEDEILDEWEVTNIVDNIPIIREIPASGSIRGHMEPLFFGVGKFGPDTNYDDFKALTITFRFRRVKPRGNEGV